MNNVKLNSILRRVPLSQFWSRYFFNWNNLIWCLIKRNDSVAVSWTEKLTLNVVRRIEIVSRSWGNGLAVVCPGPIRINSVMHDKSEPLDPFTGVASGELSTPATTIICMQGSAIISSYRRPAAEKIESVKLHRAATISWQIRSVYDSSSLVGNYFFSPLFAEHWCNGLISKNHNDIYIGHSSNAVVRNCSAWLLDS